MTRNVKPAPDHLTANVTAKLVGDWPVYGQGITRIPVLDQPLSDRCPEPKGGACG